MVKCRLVLFFFFCNLVVVSLSAQTLSVVSHYPASAFISQRLLPFEISGDSKAYLRSVRLTHGENCQAVLDPFYKQVFHVFCKTPALVSVIADVVKSDGESIGLQTDSFNVLESEDSGASWSINFKKRGENQ